MGLLIDKLYELVALDPFLNFPEKNEYRILKIPTNVNDIYKI